MILRRWSGEAKVNSLFLGAGLTYTTEEFCGEPEPTDTDSSLDNSLTTLQIPDLNVCFTFRKTPNKNIWKCKDNRQNQGSTKESNELGDKDSIERYISLSEAGFQGGEGIRVKVRILGEKQEGQPSLGPFQTLGFPQFSFLLLFPMYLELTFCLVSGCSAI